MPWWQAGWKQDVVDRLSGRIKEMMDERMEAHVAKSVQDVVDVMTD